MKKRCSSCKSNKTLDNFYKNKSNKDGLAYSCKPCHREIVKMSRIKNIEKYKISSQNYYLKNKSEIKQKVKIWKSNNPDKVRESDRKSLNRRRKNNPLLRIKHSLNSRLLKKLKSKNNKTFELIGCTPTFLKEHLESKFQSGMTWDNYGKDGWHIDHIIPCSAFDLTNYEEQVKCFNYTNLQPLWATNKIAAKYSSKIIGNINKSDKLFLTL